MQSLKELINRYAKPGQLDWIGLRPARRAEMVSVPQVVIGPRGLDGDHGASDKRAVTLIQAEHLPVIGAMLGREIEAAMLRRNLLVSGLNLAALKGREIRIGETVLEIASICAPCSRMEETLGHGGYSAMRGHGGWCARVVAGGLITLQDTVTPL
ncbi:MOSC domain-containing protein [uncultured Roseobacter sp.]|uniref:MOSC domain-containing protein n=1 Tax=uncultured Roseobacter sp. TaxID=114847 RepID=UPI002633E8E3|nr:MOSC domain-containing protein [uncultured Roseobacter sp.]